MINIEKKLDYIKSKGFIIKDELFVFEYLEKVCLHKLSKYFKNFKGQENVCFSEVIKHYLFDLELRNINLGLLEHIENSFKLQMITFVGDKYLDKNIYNPKYVETRLNFIKEKIEYLKENDLDIKKIKGNYIPCNIFIDRLTFGEIVKVYRDLNYEFKYKISIFYGIKNIHIFQNWIYCLKYLRNLCSHGENIFNRLFVNVIEGNKITKLFCLEQNNMFISFFVLLSIFNKNLAINSFYEEKVFSEMKKYGIGLELFGINKKSPSVFGHNSEKLEAWKVLVQPLYDFYIKKSNIFLKKEKSDKKTILITGGTGYIGSHGVVVFEQAGYKIVIIDNLCNSYINTLEGIDKILGYKPDFYEVDLRDKEKLEEVFKKYDFDGVIHFAGLKAPFESQEKSILYFQNNITGSLNLFEIMEKYRVKNIVFSSSANTYSTSNIPPIKEDCIQSTTNSYGTTKLLIEKILEDLSKFCGFKVINLRYFNPIGAHPSGLLGELPDGIPNNLFPYIFKVLTGELDELNVFGGDYDTIDGTGIRDYIDVCDLVDAHLLAYNKISNIPHHYRTSSTSLNTNGRLNIEEGYINNYNVGVGKGITVLEAIKATEKVLGKKVNYKIIERRQGDIPISFCDISKIRNELGLEPKVSLEESLKNSWKFYSN